MKDESWKIKKKNPDAGKRELEHTEFKCTDIEIIIAHFKSIMVGK